jgi:hypothetical protein
MKNVLIVVSFVVIFLIGYFIGHTGFSKSKENLLTTSVTMDFKRDAFRIAQNSANQDSIRISVMQYDTSGISPASLKMANMKYGVLVGKSGSSYVLISNATFFDKTDQTHSTNHTLSANTITFSNGLIYGTNIKSGPDTIRLNDVISIQKDTGINNVVFGVVELENIN